MIEDSPTAANVINAMGQYSQLKTSEDQKSSETLTKLREKLKTYEMMTAGPSTRQKRQNVSSLMSSDPESVIDPKRIRNSTSPKKVDLSKMRIIGEANGFKYDVFIQFKAKIGNKGTIRTRYLDLHATKDRVVIKTADDIDGPKKLLSTTVLFFKTAPTSPAEIDQRNRLLDILAMLYIKSATGYVPTTKSEKKRDYNEHVNRAKLLAGNEREFQFVDSNGKYICVLCKDTNYEKATRVTEHIEEVHLKLHHKCSYCDVLFSNENNFNAHRTSSIACPIGNKTENFKLQFDSVLEEGIKETWISESADRTEV